MTKFIFHGGFPKEVKKFDNALFEALQNDVPDKGTVLLVYFAKPVEMHQELYDLHLPALKEASNGKKINYLLASEQNFIEQIKQADALYLAGGDGILLREKFKQYPTFSEAIKNKIVLGSSAGANVLSKYFYSSSGLRVFKGAGIVPVLVRAHDNGDQKVYEELQSQCPECQLVALKELEMKILKFDI